jgi:hypothetical protein
MSTKFWMDYSTKPMHFFGFFGLAATGAGILTGSLLLLQKLSARAPFISDSTLAFATIALLVAGVQIMCLGLVSEMLSRTYYESQKKPIYVARALNEFRSDSAIKLQIRDYSEFEEDSAHDSEIEANQSLRPVGLYAERPALIVSADQPTHVRKVPRNEWS